MEGRALKRREDHIEARAELVRADILVHLIEAQARIDGQLIGESPLVLDIDSVEPAQLRDRVGYGKWRIDIVAAVTECAWLDGRQIGVLRLLGRDREAGAQSVRVVDSVGAVAL